MTGEHFKSSQLTSELQKVVDKVFDLVISSLTFTHSPICLSTLNVNSFAKEVLNLPVVACIDLFRVTSLLKPGPETNKHDTETAGRNCKMG